MTTSQLRTFYRERAAEIDDYVALLTTLDSAAKSGQARVVDASGLTTDVVSNNQLRMLLSNAYVQLYNLVEATITRCLEAVETTIGDGKHMPTDLNDRLRGEWVRHIARTHTELNPAHRHDAALRMFDHFAGELPVSRFQFEIGGGGNWDENSIERITARLGCPLVLTPTTTSLIKFRRRDDMGAMALVKDRRNRLAHGSLSFVDCSDGVSVTEIVDVAAAVTTYLGELVDAFDRYASSLQPAGGAAS